MSTIPTYADSTVDDDGSQLERNKIKYATIQTDLTDPLHDFITSNLEQANFSATAAPIATTHHAGTDYGVGSLWVDETNDRAYICVDATTSAGVWRQIGSPNASNLGSLATTEDNFIVGTGSGFALETPAQARSSLGASTVGGNLFTASTEASARSSIGLGTGNSPQFNAINLGHASDTTLTRSSAGVLAVEGSIVMSAPSTSSDPGLALDTWRTPNSNRPTWVTIEMSVQTDGVSDAFIDLDVDESGGTTSDYSLTLAEAPAELGDGGEIANTTSFLVPAGGSYKFRNASNPNNFNGIILHREFTL